MLKNSFQHIPGIGTKTELQLWDFGLREWQDALNGGPYPVPAKRMETLKAHAGESIQQLNTNNPRYFADLLPPKEHWRFFPEFRNSTAYIDIETTGLEAWDTITTIALYDGRGIRYYVQGRNLEDFIEDIRQYTVLVTFNGKTFDVPFIERQFGVRLDHAHIDLRYVLKSLGYAGGLKRCEHELGISRGDLEGVDGYFAILLWADYQQNANEKALETLLAYNIEDVVNLEHLMVLAYNMKLKGTPFAETCGLPRPNGPELPFSPDPGTIARLKKDAVPSFY
ncbi:MAG: ribonuclease H-like domain-containing protein [Desulfobacter sp.]|nr:MAG: ribonuclease H-like domain-containing protein [Desulfobacter sp.]